MSLHEFQFRLWLRPDEVEDVETWGSGLESMDNNVRSISDWSREHLIEFYTVEDHVRVFGLDQGKAYQVWGRATIEGFGPDHNGEYDEEMNVVEFKAEEVPKGYREMETELII